MALRLFAHNLRNFQDKKQLIAEIKKDQKKESRSRNKKRKPTEVAADADPKQPKLVNFGIVRYAEKKTNKARPTKVHVSRMFYSLNLHNTKNFKSEIDRITFL